MDYFKILLDALNSYSEDDIESREQLRDIVCMVSDNPALKMDPMVKELLYLASVKMRMFGYNIKNEYFDEPVKSDNGLAEMRAASIYKHYQSKTWSGRYLDKSQKELLDCFQGLQKKRMLVSAPTSYGKTHLMREMLYLNHTRYRNILLVFPTVALLKENALEMEAFTKAKELDYEVIIALNMINDIEKPHIFVFTPERALQLLALYPELGIDFFFFDEVYKIDEDFCHDDTYEPSSSKKNDFNILDGIRAKTFRIALYLLAKQVPEYYLAGPNFVRENYRKGMSRFLKLNDITVKEIGFEPTVRIPVKTWNTKLVEEHRLVPEKVIRVSNKKSDKMCDIIEYVRELNYGKVMLYCNSPAKVNEYASHLAQYLDEAPIDDPQLNIFLSHIKNRYDVDNSSKDWSFWQVLKCGFAMHHGKLPRYIQTEVLRQFNTGPFNILFCTSTIVEGVNTSAKNMVILNSSKGNAKLTAFDIKNIKGRAGRYYHNFVGRVFYTEREQYELERDSNLALNFCTYDEPELSSVDLDNAEIDDLLEYNKNRKQERIIRQHDFSLPEAVLIKNRLIPREYQEALLKELLNDVEIFEKFKVLAESRQSVREKFLSDYLLPDVLELFVRSEMIGERTKKVYNAAAYNYQKNGIKGILTHEITLARKDSSKVTIDQAYSNAFATLKNIIEYKIPNMLSLFDSILIYALDLEQVDTDEFTLSKVIRFYETGVRSDLGETMMEYGFPTDTMRTIEDVLPELKRTSAHEAIDLCRNAYRKKIEPLLDKYEEQLFIDVMKKLQEKKV